MKKLHIMLILPLFMVSCSGYPVKRYAGTTTEKIEKCMYRLVERNGVTAKEAQEVCEATFRHRELPIGDHRLRR